MFQDLAKEDHPATKFSCGSKETLISDEFDILAELVKFDESHYSSDIMSLAVVSNLPIDELEKLVDNTKFDEIP